MKIHEIKPNDIVYVRNLTRTDINLTVFDSKDHPLLILIPRASIPQDITEVATADMLKDSIPFKLLLQNGALELVPKEVAEVELQTKEGKMQLALLEKIKRTVPDELKADSTSAIATNLSPMDAIAGGYGSEEIRPQLRDIVLDNDSSAQDIHTRLVIFHKEEPFNREELDFLLSSISDDYVDILGWLKDIKQSTFDSK